MLGIPVYVGEEDQHRLGGHAMFFLKYRLNVVLDFQYDDAVKLLEDPDHQVAEPVDIEEFRNYQQQAQPDVLNRMIGWLIGAVIVCLGLLYVMYQVAHP